MHTPINGYFKQILGIFKLIEKRQIKNIFDKKPYKM